MAELHTLRRNVHGFPRWQCPLCNIASRQPKDGTFQYHMNRVHPDQIEEKRKALGDDQFINWYNTLETQAAASLMSVSKLASQISCLIRYRSKASQGPQDQSGPDQNWLEDDPSDQALGPQSASDSITTASETKTPSQPGFLSSRFSPIKVSAHSRGLNLLLQPESRPVSQERLVAETMSIYSGLAMVEAQCIHILTASEVQFGPWIRLHKSFLDECLGFFLVSQHPDASHALKQLATTYKIPERMWRRVHSFVELLQHELPASLEFMISFVYPAYQMMTLLYETVPSLENTWMGFLRDFSPFMAAVEGPGDREVWTGVAEEWASKIPDLMPNRGELYHHMALLAKPNALKQVYFYSRSLISVDLFLSARESTRSLFKYITEKIFSAWPQLRQFLNKSEGFYFRFMRGNADLYSENWNEKIIMQEEKTTRINGLRAERIH